MNMQRGMRSINLSAFSVPLVIMALFVFTTYTPAQETGNLETECVTLATAGTFVVPEGLTAEEACKAVVAFLGQEWSNRAKSEAMIGVVDELFDRVVAAELTVVQLQHDVAALQTQTSLQPQIDEINARLANVAAALQ